MGCWRERKPFRKTKIWRGTCHCHAAVMSASLSLEQHAQGVRGLWWAGRVDYGRGTFSCWGSNVQHIFVIEPSERRTVKPIPVPIAKIRLMIALKWGINENGTPSASHLWWASMKWRGWLCLCSIERRGGVYKQWL